MDVDWLKKRFSGKNKNREINVDAQKIAKLYYLATVDTKTQLYNYRYFNSQMKRELAVSERYNRHLSIVIFDIDDFKKINDNHGYLRGDEILQMVSTLIKSSVRDTDVPARFGGEEFTVLMPETTEEDAKRMSERIREIIMADKFLIKYGITVSVGVAQLPQKANIIVENKQTGERSSYSQFMPTKHIVEKKEENKDSKDNHFKLFDMANKALRYAKQHGKNKTIAFSELDKLEMLDRVMSNKNV